MRSGHLSARSTLPDGAGEKGSGKGRAPGPACGAHKARIYRPSGANLPAGKQSCRSAGVERLYTRLSSPKTEAALESLQSRAPPKEAPRKAGRGERDRAQLGAETGALSTS